MDKWLPVVGMRVMYTVCRRKLIAKIDGQIQFSANKDFTPTQHKWVAYEHGNQCKVEVAKRVKRWWTTSVDGKINLVVRYGSKPLEFANGKNTIELASEAEVADVLALRCMKLLNLVSWTR